MGIHVYLWEGGEGGVPLITDEEIWASESLGVVPLSLRD